MAGPFGQGPLVPNGLDPKYRPKRTLEPFNFPFKTDRSPSILGLVSDQYGMILHICFFGFVRYLHPTVSPAAHVFGGMDITNNRNGGLTQWLSKQPYNLCVTYSLVCKTIHNATKHSASHPLDFTITFSTRTWALFKYIWCGDHVSSFDSVENPTTQIPMDLNFIDPRTRVLNSSNYC